MSPISGGAGWWKSPSPDLRGLRVGNCPELPEELIATAKLASSLRLLETATLELRGFGWIQL
jgi:hypothetical protein